MNYNKKETRAVIDYPIIESKKEGVLHLSPELKTQIDTFHSFAGSTEWSGVLLYTIDKGDISDPTKLQITAKGMFPMDIGSPGYTEYDYDENTLDMYDFYPDALKEEWRLGHIHTHHNMKAYFSGTDLQELRDNIDNHAYYLSLIVNFEGKYCAKMCIRGLRSVKENSVLEYTGLKSSKKTVQEHKQQREETIVYTVALDIKIPEVEPDPSFINELLKLKKRQAKEKSSYSSYGWSKSNGNSGYNNGYSVNPSARRSTKQLDLWENGYDKKADYTITVRGFLIKLLRIEPEHPSYASHALLEETVKEYTKKYENMTMTDKDLYMTYMEDNVDTILSAMVVPMSSRDEIVDDSISVLEEWTSSTYGPNSYQRCHFIDEICNMLCEYQIAGDPLAGNDGNKSWYKESNKW